MALPVVAIVGRPNVGKSSLLNSLAGRLISIVDPTAGVTRDRVSAICEIDETYFELVDTGGYGIEDSDQLTEHVEQQIMYAVSQASLVLFVVDVRAGVAPLDKEVAQLLRRFELDVVLVANKADTEKHETASAEFYSLGFGEPMCVSAKHGRGRDELIQRILESARSAGGDRPSEPVMRIALVGRRNVGKSTFVNALAGQERVIVSEVPGTTRDAIDVQFEIDGRSFVAIDTAGVRKKSKISSDVEFYSYSRATWSIRRADVVLFLIDATEPVSQVDKKLGAYIAEYDKPVVVVINKWDLAKGRASSEDYGEYLDKVLPELRYAPITFVTAKKTKNVQATIDVAQSLFNQSLMRVGTGRLNEALRHALDVRGPSSKRGAKPPRIYYATQVGILPPTLVLFVNNPSLIDEGYRRFLLNRMREHLPFKEIPIRLLFRARRREGAGERETTHRR
ncbi:MAG: ribosome biogenesis GTPase Der [Phycisphaerae bacterium]|nr:ribosome biogenesis GTPase Der [Phycisphaerae bacterium]